VKLNRSSHGSRVISIQRLSEACMPHYDFVCNACKKTFSETLTMAEHDAEKIACPHSGSHDVKQRWSTFSAVASKKSA
jgi:putative FmdB family regulatory protein